MKPQSNVIWFPIVAGLATGTLVWVIATHVMRQRDQVGGGMNGTFFTSDPPPEISLLPLWLGIGAFMVVFSLVFVFKPPKKAV